MFCSLVDLSRPEAPMHGSMEGGTRMPHVKLRQCWRGNLQHCQPGKAIGLDMIPPEVCKHNAVDLARLSYAQLLKLALHGQEAIVHKGGKLVSTHKSKGPQDECGSYHSLLISTHQGKVLHRSLRQHQADLYEGFLQSQQIGGRRHVPVTLGLHHVRSFMRIQHHKGFSCCVLFLDLKEAFYRALRPLTHVAVLTIGFPWARITNHLAANLAPMASPQDCWFHFMFYGWTPSMSQFWDLTTKYAQIRGIHAASARQCVTVAGNAFLARNHSWNATVAKAMCHFHSTLPTSWQRHISCRQHGGISSVFGWIFMNRQHFLLEASAQRGRWFSIQG